MVVDYGSVIKFKHEKFVTLYKGFIRLTLIWRRLHFIVCNQENAGNEQVFVHQYFVLYPLLAMMASIRLLMLDIVLLITSTGI